MVGLMGLAGALSYLLKSERGYTRAIWDDILAIGITLDVIFVLVSLVLSYIPLGPFSAFLEFQAQSIFAGPIPGWTILMSFIVGFVEFIIGALLVPIIREVSKIL